MRKKYLVIGAIAAGVIAAGAYHQVSAYRGDASAKGPNYSAERHEQMQAAFESKDYNAWKELMQNRGRASQLVNENNFARFAEMHRLQLEGKGDEANAIRKELGLGQRNGSGRAMGNGQHRQNFVDANGDGVCDNRP